MTSFELTCACGHPLRGERQRRHQVVPCPACGRSSFVFPFSPYDLPAEATARPSGRWRHSWRTPWFAALGSVLLLIVGSVLGWPYLMRPPPVVEEVDASKILAESEAGRVALSEGKFH